jgi:hypothetical protein
MPQILSDLLHVLRQKMCEKELEGRNVSMAEFRSNLICSINFLSLFLLGGGFFPSHTPAGGGGGVGGGYFPIQNF